MCIETQDSVSKNHNRVARPRTVRPRAIVAMDTENMSISLGTLLEEGLNLELIDNLLKAHYEVIEKLAFVDITRINGLRKGLKEHDWCIIDVVTRPSLTKDGRRPNIGNKLDVGLSVTTLEHCLLSRPDVLVLLSGDADYISLVDRIRARNVKIHVVSPTGSLSYRLLHYCDYLSPWEKLMDPDESDEYTIAIDHGDAKPRGRSFLGAPSTNVRAEEVFRKIVEILQGRSGDREGCINAPELKSLLKKSIPHYDGVEGRHGRFKDLLQRGRDMGYFSLQHEHPRLIISLEHDITLENPGRNGRESV